MSKGAAQEAREQECRVRKLARELLVSMYGDHLTIAAMPDPSLALAAAWDIAGQFETQAEERWRKLL